MKKSWNMIPKILSGEKTIESRWYQTKRAPWNSVAVGDTVYFKNSGELVTAQATVSKVLQFVIHDANEAQVIVKKYGKKVALLHPDVSTWETVPKYCILIFLSHPTLIKKPFSINKVGFGNAAAWLCTKNVRTILSI